MRAVARTCKRVSLLPWLVVHVIGCREILRSCAAPSDASTTRNDTPSAAAVERVLWARRQREARPAGAPVSGSIVTAATQCLPIS
jgi:hypothetical protein